MKKQTTGTKNERPILFSTPMVKAILEGSKRQTRRVVKPQPDDSGLWNDEKFPHSADSLLEGCNGTVDETDDDKQFKCPYGQPGNLLWVRETWASSKALDKVKPSDILPGFPCEYKAGGTSLLNYNELVDRGRWRPSIFMPKHAARIWLKVMDVRVERLLEISDKDILSEGVRIPVNPKTGAVVIRLGVENSAIRFLPRKRADVKYTQSELLFAHWAELWCKVNGRKSWDDNPWVWVVEFEIISITGKPETRNLKPETCPDSYRD